MDPLKIIRELGDQSSSQKKVESFKNVKTYVAWERVTCLQERGYWGRVQGYSFHVEKRGENDEIRSEDESRS